MTITLSTETQVLLEDRMRIVGFTTADEAVRTLLQETLAQQEGEGPSPETLAAVRRRLEGAEAGRSRPWAAFEKEWMERGTQK